MTPKDFPGNGDDSLSIWKMKGLCSVYFISISWGQSNHGIDLVVSILGADITSRENRWEIIQSAFFHLLTPNVASAGILQ